MGLAATSFPLLCNISVDGPPAPLPQVCGFNLMAPHSGVAAAGFPKNPASLRRVLNRLIEANYTMVGGAAVLGHVSRTRIPGIPCCLRLAPMVDTAGPKTAQAFICQER